MEITKDKITEFFCIIDDFCKEYDKEISKMAIPEPDGRKHLETVKVHRRQF